jgi:hypothetical protein
MADNGDIEMTQTFAVAINATYSLTGDVLLQY